MRSLSIVLVFFFLSGILGSCATMAPPPPTHFTTTEPLTPLQKAEIEAQANEQQSNAYNAGQTSGAVVGGILGTIAGGLLGWGLTEALSGGGGGKPGGGKPGGGKTGGGKKPGGGKRR